MCCALKKGGTQDYANTVGLGPWHKRRIRPTIHRYGVARGWVHLVGEVGNGGQQIEGIIRVTGAFAIRMKTEHLLLQGERAGP